MDPSRYTVNVRCLDDFDSIVETANEKSFTGEYLKQLLTSSGRGANSAKAQKEKTAGSKATKKPGKSKAKEPEVAGVGD